MKIRPFQNGLSFAIIIAGQICCASDVESFESALTNFWSANPQSKYSPPTNYLASLKKLGADDPNVLSSWLETKEFQSSILYSMQLLDFKRESQFKPETIRKITDLLSKSSEHTDHRAVTEFLTGLPLRAPVELSDVVLSRLGELNLTNQDGILSAQRVIEKYMVVRYAFARGGIHAIGKDSATNLIASIRWPLYDHPEIAPKCASLFLERFDSLNLLRQEEFDPALEFLLNKSKADSNAVAAQLAGHCCSDTNLASVILWKLNESKDKSAVAKKALELFSVQCDRNKGILQAIQSGTVKREDAFDKSIANYRASRRLR